MKSKNAFVSTPKFVRPASPTSYGEGMRKSEMFDPKKHVCPICGAGSGEPCKSRADGKIMEKVHTTRANPESASFYM